MDQISEMGEAPLGRLLIKFSLPSIIITLVNSLYNFIDRIFIGHGMGTDALAAVTAGFPMMIIAEAVGALFSVGTSTLVSIAMGPGKRDEARPSWARASPPPSSRARRGGRSAGSSWTRSCRLRHDGSHHAHGPRVHRHRHGRLRLPDRLDGDRRTALRSQNRPRADDGLHGQRHRHSTRSSRPSSSSPSIGASPAPPGRPSSPRPSARSSPCTSSRTARASSGSRRRRLAPRPATVGKMPRSACPSPSSTPRPS